MKIEELHKLFLEASEITPDSRDAKPDSIFFVIVSNLVPTGLFSLAIFLQLNIPKKIKALIEWQI